MTCHSDLKICNDCGHVVVADYLFCPWCDGSDFETDLSELPFFKIAILKRSESVLLYHNKNYKQRFNNAITKPI